MQVASEKTTYGMEMDSLQAPLISNRDPEDRDDVLDDDGVESGAFTPAGSGSGASPADQSSPGLFMWLLTFSAGISGLLFGCTSSLPSFLCPRTSAHPPTDDTGVISATLVSIDSSLSHRPLTSLDKSIITSATSLAALAVSPFSSHLADRLGRKRVILWADLLFIAGALLQALSGTVAAMVVGRAVVGLGVGAASFVTPLYLAEMAPAAHRGRLVTMNNLFVTLGQVVAYLVGWALAAHAGGWRWMVGLGAVPAALQCALVVLMPETPRWLVRAGRADEARAVVRRVEGAGAVGTGASVAATSADAVLRDIEEEVREEEQATKARRRGKNGEARGLALWLDGWDELLSVRRNRRALVIACLLQGLQQLCGFVRGASFSCSTKPSWPSHTNTHIFSRTHSCTSRLRSSCC